MKYAATLGLATGIACCLFVAGPVVASDMHYRGTVEASLCFSANSCIYTYDGGASIVAEATQDDRGISGLFLESVTTGDVTSSCIKSNAPFTFLTFDIKGQPGRAKRIDDDGLFCCLGYEFAKSETDTFDEFRIMEADDGSGFTLEVAFREAESCQGGEVLAGSLRFTAEPTPVVPATWGKIKRLLE